MKISNDTYDKLKFIAIYIIPAFETFWLTVSQIWGLPYGQQIGLTIGAVGLLLAGCIGFSTAAYNKEKKEKHDGIAEE